jgi:hypothetical protein
MTVKGWTFVFSTLLLVTGCSKSEVVTTFEQEADKSAYVKEEKADNDLVPITFSSYFGAQATTRASVENAEQLGVEGFSVFAYYTGTSDYDDVKTTAIPNFMYNQKVNGTRTKTIDHIDYVVGDDYSPIKYWPNNEGEKITFFAYGTHVPVREVDYYKQDGTIGQRYEEYDPSEPVYGANAFKTGNSSEVVAISKSNYAGTPFLIYSMDANDGVVDIDDMTDLVVASGSYDKTKGDDVTFAFQHALSAFGFGVSGVFNSTIATDDPSATGNTINYDSFIRIEEILVSVEVGQKGVYDLAEGWKNDVFPTHQTTFRFDADHIAENLSYPNYFVYKKGLVNSVLTDVVDEAATRAKVAELTAAGKLLNYGVGRYKANDEDTTGTPIPNNDTTNYYQKVGLTGESQQNLFYFIPKGKDTENDANNIVTFTFTITYHTLTKDDRMPYGLGDVKNVVQNSVNLNLYKKGDDDIDPTGTIFMFNMMLGMSDVKFNDVMITNISFYLDNEESTPYNTKPLYYSVPK